MKCKKKLKSDLKEKNSWELSLTKIQSLMCIKFTLNFIIDDKQSTSTFSFNENDHRRNKKRTSNALSILSNSQHDSSHAFIDFKIKSRSMKFMNSSFYDWQRKEDDHYDSSYIWSESIQREREISTVAHKNIMWQTILYLRAMIMTKYASEDCKSWADSQQKVNLSTLIKSIWSRVINCIIQVINQRNDDVKMKSTSHEVRRVKQSWLNNAHSD